MDNEEEMTVAGWKSLIMTKGVPERSSLKIRNSREIDPASLSVLGLIHPDTAAVS
jgi:hypothetical protein